MGGALFSFWCHVGNAKFSLGYLVSWKDFLVGKKKKKGVASKIFVFILDSLKS